MPRKLVDITGQHFGRLLVLGVAGRVKAGRVVWCCLCECGSKIVAYGYNLRTGNTNSCGCYHREVDRKFHLQHGEADRRNGKATSEYQIWGAMIQRCDNPNNPAYDHYGGRGIKICQRWRKYENFIADMGRHPIGLTLDRINNDDGYKPSNCRWATKKQQANNRRKAKPRRIFMG